ncbi:putative tetratricopeptide-like helical domain-containing protein [Lupinus albus]|uniref:Putative tetratricopeptide-like helical domain-containing protein n=1 Tax=Lupinus albus TaxID=3870 RepID=A0A6A4R9R7_LUPAL|nr:putative tetratricopeptide-like helical domain-containing protein [Lupinus albus]
MDFSLSKIHHFHTNLSLNLHRSSLPSSSSSPFFRSFKPPPLSTSSFKLSLIKSSLNDPAFHNNPKHTFPDLLQTLISPVVETTCIVIAATAFFFTRHMPVTAANIPPLSTTVASEPNAVVAAESEGVLESRLSENPNDTEALRNLMELKIRARKINQAIQVIERLIEIEPEELEWPLLKANMHVYNDDQELARNVFEEILKRDPLRVEAYHGLVMAISESNQPLNGVLKRVEVAVENCKKEKKDSVVRDFKLLIAQIKVMEGYFSEALKNYQDLVKEEPRDFRPYLCQGIIYTLLRKKDEAEKHFEKFRGLVPKNHPYREYFEDNMFATKFFSQKFEREGAGTLS